jgi:hypothetical protein
MALNLLQRYWKAVKESISDKDQPFSITRFNVADMLTAVSKLIGIKQVVSDETYPKDWIVRNGYTNFYISKSDGVLGSQIADTTKWAPVFGGGGGSGNTTTATESIECDGVTSIYTTANPLNNPDVQVSVRYDGTPPYNVIRPDILISDSACIVDLSPFPIDNLTLYKVIFTGEQL